MQARAHPARSDYVRRSAMTLPCTDGIRVCVIQSSTVLLDALGLQSATHQAARAHLLAALFFNRYTTPVYFRGLPRFAKITPRASAAHRSRLASLSASLRSTPGGISRACSKASTARKSRSDLSVDLSAS